MTAPECKSTAKVGPSALVRLWRDDRGVVVSAELIVIVTVVVLGLLVGLTSLRDQMVQEFGDLGAAIGALDHSYSFASFSDADSSVAGSVFVDNSDYCDAGDPPGAAPLAIDFTAADAED